MASLVSKICSFSAGISVSALLLSAPTFAADQQHAALGDAATTDARILTFGIVPQQSASRLARMWGPLIERLGSDLGMTVQFRTTKDIPTFEACLARGAYDLAYMNPVHYTIFSDATGYQALAHQSEKRLRGLIVVRKDSPIQSLEDLQGTKVAFPSPGAFGASVVPRAEMRGRGIDFDPQYVKSHDSVYRAIIAGLMPAGGGVLRTLNAISDEMRSQLRVVYQTEGYTPHAIAVRTDLPDDLRVEIQNLLIRISDEAPELTKSVGMKGFETASHEQWDDVRRLELDASETGISTEGDVRCPSG